MSGFFPIFLAMHETLLSPHSNFTHMKKFFVSLFIASFVLLFSCSKKSSAPTSDSKDSTAAIDVEKLYKKSCQRCHNAEFTGNGLASDFTTSKISKEEMIKVVLNGRNRMPAFGDDFSKEELGALCDFLIAKRK